MDIKPTVHLGVAASQMEKKGVTTDRGNINRAVADINNEIRQTKARIKKVKTWLYAQPIENAPSFINIMSSIADAKNLDSRWKKIADVKTQSKVLIFLQSNHIGGMDDFVNKITQVNEDLQSVSEEIKKVDRRLDTLAQHLAQVEIRRQHRAVYEKYSSLRGKQGEAFYDKHFEKIQQYESAAKYIQTVLNGRTKIPTGDWKAEQEKLTAHRYSLCERFYGLKDDVRMTELIKKGTEKIFQEEARDTQRSRTQGLER